MPEIVRLFIFTFLLNTPHYVLCCAPFFPDLRVKKRTVFSLIVLTGIVMAILSALMRIYIVNWQRFNTPFLLLFYMLYFIQYKICFKISLFKLFYIFLIVQAYSTIINITAKFIDVQLYPEHVKVVVATSYSFIVMGLMVFTYPILYQFFKKTFSKVFREYPDKSFWMLCITPILFFIINMVYTSLFLQQSYSQIDMFIMFILIMITGFVTYYLTLRTGVDMANSIQARTEMEGQLALQVQHYKQITETIEHARAARHDLRHHLSVLSAYLKKDDKTGMQDYLNEYLTGLPDDTISTLCKNYAVDAVVRHYLILAREAGAELDVQLRLPEDTGIPDSDLCIVFGNIFENAAESCCRQQSGRKFISARCESKDGRILLAVDNSGDKTNGGKAGRFKGQGIGLRSVRTISEKWNGSLAFVREGDIYKTSVIMMSKKH